MDNESTLHAENDTVRANYFGMNGNSPQNEVNFKIKKEEMKTQDNAWIKMGRLYRRIPILGFINPLVFPVVIFCGLIIYTLIFGKEPVCTCAELISDDKLTEMGKAGNKEVQEYLAHIDDYLNCEAKRQTLLKKLELEKQKKGRFQNHHYNQ